MKDTLRDSFRNRKKISMEDTKSILKDSWLNPQLKRRKTTKISYKIKI